MANLKNLTVESGATFNGKVTSSGYTVINSSNLHVLLGSGDTLLISKLHSPLSASSFYQAASVTLNSDSANTYQSGTVTRTSITLTGGKANPYYIHYLLLTNSGNNSCVIAPPSGSVAPSSTFTIPSGGVMEISYIYDGSKLIFTSTILNVF